MEFGVEFGPGVPVEFGVEFGSGVLVEFGVEFGSGVPVEFGVEFGSGVPGVALTGVGNTGGVPPIGVRVGNGV